MIKVFVLDKNLTPQDPVHPAVARILLNERKARIHRAQPFCIRLRSVSRKTVNSLQFKLDPGSVTTGIALVNYQSGEVVWGAELTHHGKHIKKKLEKRAAQRSARRSRKTRYRPARFLNRTKPKGWLPPSLEHRILNTVVWVDRICKLVSIMGISLELVKFDIEHINGEGREYNHATLSGHNIREILLEKFNRTCIYCGAKGIPLQIEHIIPKARGGTNCISNLTLACNTCNKAKGALLIEEFLKDRQALFKKIKAQIKKPLRDAAVMNATRWELWRRLSVLGFPVECGSGALTKFNRTKQGLPKAHWLDAACVGKSTPTLALKGTSPLYLQSYSRGSRQRCKLNAYGFPVSFKTREKTRFNLRTGDWVKAVLPKGKLKGTHIGRLITRAKPSFCVGSSDGINPRYIMLLQRNDGYGYTYV